MNDFKKSEILRKAAAGMLDDYGVEAFNKFVETNPKAIPCRIQRKRTKGWKMPDNTVYVGRGSKYGNPFEIGIDGTREQVIDRFRRSVVYMATWANDQMEAILVNQPVIIDLRAGAVNDMVVRAELKQLKGKNLACWCKHDEPCHADILLEVANRDLRSAKF